MLRNRRRGQKSTAQLARCSFCRRTSAEAKKLIAGPAVYICDQCVGLCQEILDEELDTTVR